MIISLYINAHKIIYFIQIIYTTVKNAKNELDWHLLIICHECVFDIIGEVGYVYKLIEKPHFTKTPMAIIALTY